MATGVAAPAGPRLPAAAVAAAAAATVPTRVPAPPAVAAGAAAVTAATPAPPTSAAAEAEPSAAAAADTPVANALPAPGTRWGVCRGREWPQLTPRCNGGLLCAFERWDEARSATTGGRCVAAGYTCGT